MKNTDTHSQIERLKEALAAWGRYDPDISLVRVADLAKELAAAAHAALETLPSAGEGVERAKAYSENGLDFVQYEIERVISRRVMEDRISGYTLEMAQELAAVAREALAALPSPPLEQPDIEGRARELLARFHESGGNRAAAFTVRKVGPTGIVLEAQHAVLVYALSLPEIRREAWQPIETGETSHANAAVCLTCGFCNTMPLELLSGDWRGLECGRCGEALQYRGHATGDTSQGEFEIRTRLCPKDEAPSRPSFDKWDYARAVLADARCAK